MAADSNPTKEILIREDKVEGGLVRVYSEIDEMDEQERLVGEPRIVFVDSETAEEVPTKPLSVDIEPLRKRQDLWLLEKPSPPQTQGTLAATRLEGDLASKRPINSEWAFYPKAWLTENNWKFYVDQLVEHLEHWKRENGPHDLETAQTLEALKEEQKAWKTKGKPKENLPPAERSSPHHLIIWSCYTQMREKLKNQPSARQVWYELLNNHEVYDPSKTIEEVTEEQIEWYDTKGNKQRLKRSSLDAALSRMRSHPPTL